MLGLPEYKGKQYLELPLHANSTIVVGHARGIIFLILTLGLVIPYIYNLT